jgi:hypothetical protein
MMKAYVCTLHYTDKVVFHHTIFANAADAIEFCNRENERERGQPSTSAQDGFLRAEFTEMELDDRAIAIKALKGD